MPYHPAMPADTPTPVDPCLFCQIVAGRDRPLLLSTPAAVAFADHRPSTPGHILVVPRDHLPRLGDVPGSTQRQMWAIAGELMGAAGQPDGWTIGINDGPAAGQTIPHTHLHLIPRVHGDTADPRGGIRWAVPETAAYWNGPTRQ